MRMDTPQYGDLVSYVSVLERRVNSLYALGGAAAFLTDSLLSVLVTELPLTRRLQTGGPARGFWPKEFRLQSMWPKPL